MPKKTIKPGENTGKDGGIYREVGSRGGEKDNFATIRDDQIAPPTEKKAVNGNLSSAHLIVSVSVSLLMVWQSNIGCQILLSYRANGKMFRSLFLSQS